MRLSVRIKHKVRDEYGRHKENDLSNVSSKHNAGVCTVIVTYDTWEISMKEIEAQAAKGVESGAKSATTLYRIIAFLHHENIPEELFKNAAENYKKRNIDVEQKLGLPLSVTMLDPNVLFLDRMGEWDIMQFQQGIQVLLSFSLLMKS